MRERADEAQTCTHLTPLPPDDLVAKLDEMRRFIGETYVRLERRITSEYAMVRSTLHQHGEQIGKFLAYHEECLTANERARAEAERRLSELQEQLVRHTSEDFYYPRPRTHRDSEAIEASLRVGRKVSPLKSFVAALAICILILALGYAAQQLR